MSVVLPEGTHPEMARVIGEIHDKATTPTHPQMTAAPVISQVPVGGFVHATVGGTQYIYSNIGGKLYRAVMTAV